MQRPKIAALSVAIAVLLPAGWWFWRSSSEQSASDTSRAREHRGAVSSTDASGPGLTDGGHARADSAGRRTSDSSARERQATFDRAKRDALRTEILQALAERPPPRPTTAPSAEQPPPEPGQLTDRIGGREALLEHLNHDFMPLADECIEQARARRPELEGMLALGFDTVADEELGGIVESVTVQPQNEVDDAELLECLSQTALSMILPPPPESGREQFMITMPIEPPSD